MTDVMTMPMNGFMEMENDEMFIIDGGVNWDRVFGGASVYLAATIGVCAITGPVGWGVAISYWALSAGCGAFVGYGLAS